MKEDLNSYAKTYQNDDIIFLEFEPGNTFYLIQSGSVRISKIINGIEKTIDILTAGDIFGEMAILEEELRSASAIANEESILIEFNKKNFESLLTSNTQLAFKILRLFAKRIFDAKKRTFILQIKEPELRVNVCFIVLAEFANIPRDSYFQPQVIDTDASEIASWCGLSVKDVQAVLSKMTKAGKIDVRENHIIVKNLNESLRLAGNKRKYQS